MSMLKCKMCGGDLSYSEGDSIATCEYCGSQQTLPKYTDEKLASFYERANTYRSNNEFDKASMLYENILLDKPNDAEAHWGICLCRYGIEYVEDPRTGKRIPTCHRAQFKSILNDFDYLAAIENADVLAKQVYISEAEYIDKVQKNILLVSSKEKPYDIFICYKETDENGDRTIDSVIAQKIYDELTDIGYNVFFSRITLEDKLGVAYEPYIFAALNSSKIMLVVGTKPEYFEAVWVKNEWSRFLGLISEGAKKTMIPCYKNITPNELPREFAVLQSLDLSKIGWEQDLVRGIKKILADYTPPKQEKYNDGGTTNNNSTQRTGTVISSVTSRGALNIDDYWPQTSLTSVLDKRKFSHTSFQLALGRAYSQEKNVSLEFMVLDELGNTITNSNNTIHVVPGNDRLAQTWTLVGDDGTSVNDGIYRAKFSVDGGPWFEYNFKVVSGSGYNNPVTPNPTAHSNVSPQKTKNFSIYLLLCLFLGYMGIHCFYAGKTGKGILMLILTCSSALTFVSVIMWILDIVKAFKTREVPIPNNKR